MLVKVMAPNMTWLHLENFTVTAAINSKFIMSLAYPYTKKKYNQVNNVLNNMGIGDGCYYCGEEKLKS